MDTQSLAHDTQIVNRPARMIGAIAESRLQSAQDAARYHGYDNAEGLDPLDEQTAWSPERGYHRQGQAADHDPASETAKSVIAALRQLQGGKHEPGIAAMCGDQTIRLHHRADLYYTLSQVILRASLAGRVAAHDDCREILACLTERRVVDAITVRAAYGQTHARLAYRLSPRVSVSDLDALIGGAPHVR